MADHDEIAVAAGVESGERDDADTARVDRCSLRLREVQPGVEASRRDPTEAVSDRARYGPEEAMRAAL
jgi:hypothetical protein